MSENTIILYSVRDGGGNASHIMRASDIENIFQHMNTGVQFTCFYCASVSRRSLFLPVSHPTHIAPLRRSSSSNSSTRGRRDESADSARIPDHVFPLRQGITQDLFRHHAYHLLQLQRTENTRPRPSAAHAYSRGPMHSRAFGGGGSILSNRPPVRRHTLVPAYLVTYISRNPPGGSASIDNRSEDPGHPSSSPHSEQAGETPGVSETSEITFANLHVSGEAVFSNVSVSGHPAELLEASVLRGQSEDIEMTDADEDQYENDVRYHDDDNDGYDDNEDDDGDAVSDMLMKTLDSSSFRSWSLTPEDSQSQQGGATTFSPSRTRRQRAAAKRRVASSPVAKIPAAISAPLENKVYMRLRNDAEVIDVLEIYDMFEEERPSKRDAALAETSVVPPANRWKVCKLCRRAWHKHRVSPNAGWWEYFEHCRRDHPRKFRKLVKRVPDVDGSDGGG